MESPLLAHADTLANVARNDPDPRVRLRAQGLHVLCGCKSQAQAARLLGTGSKQLRTWQTRFLAEGRDGLADRPRCGRPRIMTAEADALVQQALERPPSDYEYPVASWTVADLRDLLARNGWNVSMGTVYHTLHRLDYRHRRPRHDLTHRQDADAVASAQATLQILQKRGLITPAEFACSTSMKASCIPIPTWQKSGSGRASARLSLQPASTGGSPSSARSSTDRER